MKKDELERKILELLELVAAKGIKELYQDACSLLSCDNLQAHEKAIGNYLREIDSALLAVTINLAKLNRNIEIYEEEMYCSKTGKKIKRLKRSGKINLIIEHFKPNLSNQQIKFWKNLELHKLAHRSGLRSNKGISESFIDETWIPYSEIILEIAESINKIFMKYYEQLENLAKTPSKESCTIVLQEIPNNPHLRAHFFKNIKDFASWIPMLRSKKVFKDVPLEYANEEGYLVIQAWPPLDFLLRVINETQDNQTLKKVAEIASNIPITDNLRVNDDFLILAGKLSAELSSKHLMPRIKTALSSKSGYTMGEKVSGLLGKLHDGGFNDNLLEITKIIISDKKLNSLFAERYIGNSMNLYCYNGLLTILCNYHNIDIFHLLLERSLEGLSLSFKDNQSEKYGTIYWRDAFNDEIEKDELASMYISKLSLASKNLITSNNTLASEIINHLYEANKKQDWYIINALILNLLETSENEIDNNLKSELQEKLADYEVNRKEREQPIAQWVNNVSPYSDEELSKLPANEILKKLRQYNGPIEDKWKDTPSKAGLLQSIKRQIKKKPNDFVKCVEDFTKLNINDYSCLMYYFSQIEFQANNEFKNNYLLLVKDFIENKYNISTTENRRDFSRSIFSVFRKIYNKSETYLDIDSIAFKALDTIINDKSINSAILSSTRDAPFTELAGHAINTPSIEAFNCLLNCYLTPGTEWKNIWKRKDINDFKSYIISVIQTHESGPFRFMIGEKIHSLLGIGEKWFEHNLQNIVLNKDINEQWEAFVAGVMSQGIICNDILNDVYIDAIKYVSTKEYLSNHHDRDDFAIEKGIARHISFYYCQLDNQNCTENSLTNYIFVHGSLPLKKAFLVETKQLLKKNDSNKKSFNKFKELIDWRYDELRKINFNPDRIQELSGFFTLFPIAVKFDPEWSLKHLNEFMNLLETNGEPFHPDLIIDALIEQAENFSFITAECLLSWVKGMKNKWYDSNDIKKLIEKLHQHGDKSTHTVLKEVVSRLSSKGICCEMIALFNNN